MKKKPLSLRESCLIFGRQNEKKKKQLLAAINKRITNTMRRIMYDLYYPDLLEELGTNTTYFLFDGIYPYGK